MGRRRGHKRGLEKRTVLVLFLLVCLLGAAILWARSRDTESLKPPSLTPEEQARIESPENAYNVLIEALKLLPESKPPLKKYPVAGKPGEMRYYETEPDSIARELDVWAPDDAPEIAAYVEQYRPSIEKAREAFNAPYFRMPEPEDNVPRFHVSAFVTPFRVSYRHAWEIRGERQESLGILVDAIRLCRLLRQDGDTYRARSLQSQEQKMWSDLVALYLAAPEDSVDLSHAFELMQGLDDAPQLTYQRLIDAQWRTEWTRLENMRDQSPGGLGHARFLLYARSQHRVLREIIERKEYWLQVLSLPYPQFEGSVSDNVDAFLGEHEHFDGPAYHLWLCKYEEACCIAVQRQILLMTLLEMYRRDKGEYPPTLAHAVEERLESVPEDPFTGKPFQYNPDMPEQLIVSPGPKLYPRSWYRPEITWEVEVVNGVVDVQRTRKQE